MEIVRRGEFMKNLYIDFDGVILDTITPVYDLARRLNLDVKTQTKEVTLQSDMEIAQSVIDRINEIGKVTKNSQKAIERARILYNEINKMKEEVFTRWQDPVIEDQKNQIKLLNDLRIKAIDLIKKYLKENKELVGAELLSTGQCKEVLNILELGDKNE